MLGSVCGVPPHRVSRYAGMDVSSQDDIAMRPDVFIDWYKALAGGRSLASWGTALGINDNLIASIEENEMKACLVLALHLLANNHLPPLEQQRDVKKEFTNGGLRGLYDQLKEANDRLKGIIGIYVRAILQNIDHLGRQEGGVI
jgi:hypothetical protein